MNPFKSTNSILKKSGNYLKSTTGHDLTSWSIFLLAIVGILGIIFFPIVTKTPLSNTTSQSIILWITAVSVFMYTRETRDLKIVTQKQLEEARRANGLLTRPFIRLQWSNASGYNSDPKNIGRYHIKIINEGIGIVVNLQLTFSHSRKSYGVTAMGGQKVYLPITEPNYEDFGYENQDQFLAEIDPIHLKYTAKVEYRDITRKLYTQTFSTDPSFNDKFRLEAW